MSNAALAFEGAGLVLDRYRPLRPLGSGGSGSVWLARDEKTGLDVALKIVAREGKAAARAEREAAAAARLRHPACLRAYAFARDSRHVYIAYEFVPGRTYREAMRAGELNDAAAIEACAQICEALAHAHGNGILHRDVKPSNVLLADGDRVSARLLDFGLARMAEAETLTAQGDVPGTLAYIAPERLAGDNATEASDVWAVGVMLWESLSGRHPFWQTSMLDTARAIEQGAESLASLRPDLPKGLIDLVDRSLSLSPARRPSAVDLAHALRGAATPRRKRKGTQTFAGPVHLPQVGSAALAGAFAAWTAVELPFFPHGWPVALALVAAAVTGLRPRLGLALALAVPVLPLGNVSSGLALLYALIAAAWLVFFWREPRDALLCVLGVPLSLVGMLGLAPLVVWRIGSNSRRAVLTAMSVVIAGIVAGIRGATLPFTGVHPPLGLGVAGSTGPFDVAGTLARHALDQPALLTEAGILAAVALALPYARARGRWGAAGLGAAMLCASVLAVPAAAALPLVAAAWITAAVLALRVP
ncbi:MAG TPA: serine/threonine-protein kinase [Gaiellaceae bacterium]